jgi:processive 1,2-diacylglycerol beta-glucosyltransferase
LNQRPEAGELVSFSLPRLFESTPKTEARRSRRLLVLSVSAGSGHVRAAEAIEACAEKEFPQLSVLHCDVMQFVPGIFRKIYTDLYLSLASHLPEAWGWLYRKTDQPRSGKMDALRCFIQDLCTRKLIAKIYEEAPEAIICTHFLPAEILMAASRRGQLQCPVWIQVTDFDVHRMWLHEGIAGYFVANTELAFRLQAHGVAASRVFVTGIPVMPGFSAPHEKATSLRTIGLEASNTTVLLMGGGAGIGSMDALARQLLELNDNLQLIVLAGKNKTLLASLQSLASLYPNRLVPVGFTQEVHQLMSCADIVITKPGGLSTSECLVMGVPMVLVNPIPGQEERNADFLLQEGVAIRADDPATLQFRLQALLADRDALARMRMKALALAKPAAATMLLQHVGARLWAA